MSTSLVSAARTVCMVAVEQRVWRGERKRVSDLKDTVKEKIKKMVT